MTLSIFKKKKIQPTVAEYKELLWLAGNLKLEVTEQPQLDDDDAEVTLCSRSRKRHYQW